MHLSEIEPVAMLEASMMKQKYTSKVPALIEEQQRFKQKLTEQKHLISKMKQSKLRTTSIN